MQNVTQDGASPIGRSKKYDTYIPPTVSVHDKILSDAALVSPVVTSQQPVEQTATVAAAMPAYNHIPNKITFSNYTSKSNKKRNRQAVIASILHATVKVDAVTRQSMRAVKHSFEPPQTAFFRTKKQKIIFRSLSAVGTASFVLLLGLGAKVLLTPQESKPKVDQSVLGVQSINSNKSSEIPSEQQPTTQDMQTYLVAPLYPRYIRIKDINVEARIRRLGLDGQGLVGSPNNINDVGWYDGSVKPGEKDGSSIIVAHEAGPTKQGVFWNLSKLIVNSIIEIEKGNGDIVTYKVTKVEKAALGEINVSKYLKQESPGKHDIKLITSAGKYDKLGGGFSDRTIVYALEQ